MKSSIRGIMKSLLSFFASWQLLVWTSGLCVMSYVAAAILMDEAFASIVAALGESYLLKILYAVFLLVAYLNFMRASVSRFRGSKTAFAGWIMIAAGALLYLTGFFISINLRQYDERLIGLDDPVRFHWSNALYRVTDINPGLKDMVRKGAEESLLNHEPLVTLRDSRSVEYHAGAYPPGKIGDSYSHILNYGIAPGVQLFDGDNIAVSGYMALRLMPPGRSDFFDIPPYPYRFLVYLLPVYERGDAVFDLKSPRYMTRVFSGEEVIAEGDSDSGLKFDGHTLRYFKPKYWIQLETARDPGIPVMKTGIFVFVFGLPVYLFSLILSVMRFRGRTSDRGIN